MKFLFLILIFCLYPINSFAGGTTNVPGQDDIGSFFLIASLVLFPAYLLSWFCGKVKLPEYLGAIFTGLIIGKTGLGNFTPELHNYLFPNDSGFDSLVHLISFLGASTLMFDAGLAVNLSSVKKSAKECGMLGVVGLFGTIIVGSILLIIVHATFNVLPDKAYIAPIVIALLFAISPLTIIFKLLDECKLLGSDTAAIKLGGSAIGEIIALLIVSVLVGQLSAANSSTVYLMFPALFIALMALYIAPTYEKIVRSLSKKDEENTIAIRSIALLLAIYGAFFSFFNLPIIFGFFIAGVLLNRTSLVNPEIRRMFTQVSHQVLVPFFFAASVFEVDFLKNMNWSLMLFYTTVAILAKGLVTYIVSLKAGLTKFDSRLTAVSFIPVAVAGIALMPEFQKINFVSDEMYAAFYGSVVLTAVIAGVFFKFFAGRPSKIPLLGFLDRDILELGNVDPSCSTREEKLNDLLDEITTKKSHLLQMTPEEMLKSIYKDHNYLTGDNSEHGFLALHLRAPKIDKPKLFISRTRQGVKLPSADGERTHFIALLALPENKDRAELEVAIWPLIIKFLDTHHAHELIEVKTIDLANKLLAS